MDALPYEFFLVNTFKRACVYSYSYRYARTFGGLHDSSYFFFGTDIARVDTQFVHALLYGLDRKAPVKMNVCDKRYIYGLFYF